MIVSDAWRPQTNGVVRTYENLAAELARLGRRVSVLGPCDVPFRMPMPFYPEIKLGLFAFRGIRRSIETLAPDHIHIATEGPLGWAARRWCLRAGVPFTTSYHTHFPLYAAARVKRFLAPLEEPVQKLCVRALINFHNASSCVLVATASLEERLRSWGLRAPLRRMTRGVDLDIFHPGERTVFKDIARPVALNVGRVSCEKNLEAFLEMPWPGSKVVVGEGPALPDLKRRFPSVLFTGLMKGSALADHYRSADVFVFPSRTETFGLVIVEALACGLPVAAYDVPGPRDIVTAPFLGALGEDLAGCARAALGGGGGAPERFAHVRAHYQWSVAARQFLEAFQPAS